MTLSSSPGDLVIFHALIVDTESQVIEHYFCFFWMYVGNKVKKNIQIYCEFILISIMGMCSNPFIEWLLYAITVLIVINTCDVFLTNYLLRGADREINVERYWINVKDHTENRVELWRKPKSDSTQLIKIFPNPFWYIMNHKAWKILSSRETIFIKEWYFSFISKSNIIIYSGLNGIK